MDYLPEITSLDRVYIHMFFGSNDNHYVRNVTINETYTGSGVYRLVPPASYDRAFAFSTRDLFVAATATGQVFDNVFTLEPISGMLVLLTSAPYPASIDVSFRYYPIMLSLKVKDWDPEWIPLDEEVDLFNQGVYPLTDRMAKSVSWRFYNEDQDLIKSYLRQDVRENTFVLIIDDNINVGTMNTNFPALWRPGTAWEGPLFCKTIDSVDRGDDAAVFYELIAHQYGNYYYHSPITPTERWWPQGDPADPDEWGWTYFKGETQLLTPSVPYAWPPNDWWEDGFFHNETHVCGTCTREDMSTECSGYGGGLGDLVFQIFIDKGHDTAPADNEFKFRYSLDGGTTWVGPGAGPDFWSVNVAISGGGAKAPAWATLIPASSIRIQFVSELYHITGDFWTFLAQTGTCSGLAFSAGDSLLSVDATGYTGPKGRQFKVEIVAGMPTSPNTFRWQYNDGSGWSAWSAPANIVIGAQALPSIGGDIGQGLLINPTVDNNATGDYWTFFAESNAPLRLPALGRPPGGYVEWLSNIPNP